VGGVLGLNDHLLGNVQGSDDLKSNEKLKSEKLKRYAKNKQNLVWFIFSKSAVRHWCRLGMICLPRLSLDALPVCFAFVWQQPTDPIKR
jgi:hypothetical protein